eukprot:1472397-Amphidinium_carterae.1
MLHAILPSAPNQPRRTSPSTPNPQARNFQPLSNPQARTARSKSYWLNVASAISKPQARPCGMYWKLL